MADKVTGQEAARRLLNALEHKEKRKPNKRDKQKKISSKKKKGDQQK